MHLSEQDIHSLAYAYVKNEILTDEQLQFKWHMASCDGCFHKFLVEKEIQESLLDAGLITDSVVQGLFKEDIARKETVLLRMKKAANGFNMLIENIKGLNNSFWNFYPAPQMAFSRGENNEKEVALYENTSSEYSMIRVDGSGVLIRLDKDDYPGERLVLRIKKAGENERYIPFVYNGEEECFDAFIPGIIEPETQFEILEVYNEDK